MYRFLIFAFFITLSESLVSRDQHTHLCHVIQKLCHILHCKKPNTINYSYQIHFVQCDHLHGLKKIDRLNNEMMHGDAYFII